MNDPLLDAADRVGNLEGSIRLGSKLLSLMRWVSTIKVLPEG